MVDVPHGGAALVAIREMGVTVATDDAGLQGSQLGKGVPAADLEARFLGGVDKEGG